MDIAPPSIYEQHAFGSNQDQSFHKYFDLARAAHTTEIARLLQENEKLQRQVHRLLHQSLPSELPRQISNGGSSIGKLWLSGESDAESMQSTTPDAIPWEADQLMPNDFGEIVLLERDPDDPAPLAETQSTVAYAAKQALLAVPEIANEVLVKARWEKLTGALLESWHSDSAVIHMSWQVTLDALSMLLSHSNEQGDHLQKMSLFSLEEPVESERDFLVCEAFSPDSGFVVMWLCMGTILCVYDIVMFPLQLIEMPMSRDFVAVANFVVIVFWSVDIIISMTTGFHTKQGYKELRHTRILKRYARTWMLLDTSIVAFDWAMLALNSSDNRSVRNATRMLRLARLVRVGRLLKLGPKVWNLVGQFHSEFMFTMAKLFASLFLILVLNHYIACLFYATWDGLNCNTETYCYFVSLHWAVAHSALGPLDVMPSNEFERFFSIVVLLLSMVLFSTFVSASTTAIIHLSDLRHYKVKQESLIRRYFEENRISRELSTRIWTFIWKHNHTGKHRLRTDDVHCFTFLPDHLLDQMKYETFLPILLVHPMFRFINERCPEAMMKLCTAGVEQVIVRPSEEMNWTMDADAKKMLFVIDGALFYKPTWDPSCEQQDIPLCKIMWACEAALWCQNAAVYGPLTGGPAGADLILISAREFQSIMTSSSLRFVLSEYARLFVQRFNEFSHDQSNNDFLFNNANVVQSIVTTLESTAKTETKRRSSVGFWLNAMSGVTMKARKSYLSRGGSHSEFFG